MKTFHNLKIKTYPHKTLNSSKGVIRNNELSQCSREEIEAEVKNQGVTDIKRITIKKENQTIQSNTYILIFNSPTIPKEIKIDYIDEKIEQYIPNLFRSKPYHHWLQTQQQICQLQWRPPTLYQNMLSLEKRKRNLNYKTHQKHSLSRRSKNSWRLHKKQNLLPKPPKIRE